ncbi:hypothetical protein B0H17DRAFT_1055395 [Mycena rosella]|uniref:F-box domain-containing protein n=1 Tax=Mycena rosella TaxID=1033263 RepID=A0AAD7GKW6_MYCRO|nr:hypothetical protein B0H17DRAFT_1055395 [Mycena rosella]
MDTPAIWTELPLVLFRDNVSRDRAMLTKWVDNVSSLPVSMAVECRCPNVLQHALTQIRQFKTLRLQLHRASLCVLGPHSHSGLDVENLQVDITDRLNDAAISQPYSAFADSPSLRSFTLVSSTRYTSTIKFSLPWWQLTKLEISEPRLSCSCMAVFMGCTNLVHLALGMLEDFDYDIAPPFPSTFPFLTDASFLFEDYDSMTMQEFFRPLTFPSLKHLILEYADEAWEWPQVEFAAFQLRSSFNLETLQLEGILLDVADLRGAFESLPSLKSFTIMFVGDRRDACEVFEALTWDGVHSLLPQLERLKVRLFMCDDSLRYCIAMLKSRLGREGGPASQLQFLWLEADEYSRTREIDWWWWQWKLPLVFPTLEWKFTKQRLIDDED